MFSAIKASVPFKVRDRITIEAYESLSIQIEGPLPLNTKAWGDFCLTMDVAKKTLPGVPYMQGLSV